MNLEVLYEITSLSPLAKIYRLSSFHNFPIPSLNVKEMSSDCHALPVPYQSILARHLFTKSYPLSSGGATNLYF